MFHYKWLAFIITCRQAFRLRTNQLQGDIQMQNKRHHKNNKARSIMQTTSIWTSNRFLAPSPNIAIPNNFLSRLGVYIYRSRIVSLKAQSTQPIRHTCTEMARCRSTRYTIVNVTRVPLLTYRTQHTHLICTRICYCTCKQHANNRCITVFIARITHTATIQNYNTIIVYN